MKTAISAGRRTPFARSGSVFADLSAIELGKVSVRDALARSGLKGERVDHLVYGTVVHDTQAPNIAREVGLDCISRSSEVAPLIKLVSRAETTSLDAYLNPILAGYVGRVWEQFGGQESCRLRLMTSSGNLVDPAVEVEITGPDADTLLEAARQVEIAFDRVPQMILNPEVKNIFEFTYKDFNLVNYNPHPHIKGAVSV